MSQTDDPYCDCEECQQIRLMNRKDGWLNPNRRVVEPLNWKADRDELWKECERLAQEIRDRETEVTVKKLAVPERGR